MVSFSENPNQYNGTSSLKYLDNNIHNIMGLELYVKILDEKISLSNQYAHKIVQSERGRGPLSSGELYDTDHAGSGFRG